MTAPKTFIPNHIFEQGLIRAHFAIQNTHHNDNATYRKSPLYMLRNIAQL